MTDDISLKAPYRLVELDRWRDGGSLGFIVEDADGKVMAFCLDRKVHSPTTGRWYTGATYPTKENAAIVERGGQAEMTLQSVLQAWVSQCFDGDEQAEILESLAPHDERVRFNAWTILRALRSGLL